MKYIIATFFCISIFFSFSQNKKDSSIVQTNVTILKKDVQNTFIYKEPEYYLKRAGNIGLNKQKLIIIGGLLSLGIAASPDVSSESTIVCPSIIVLVAFFMDFAVYSNIKNAGLAIEERKNFKVGISPGGLKICYNF